LAKRFTNKVVLVTGGSRGIGRSISLAFAKDGASVCVNYRKSRNDAEDGVREIKKLGRDALGIMSDVADPSQVDAMVAKILGKFGRIDILVNNAGIIHSGKFMDLQNDKFQEMISINVIGSVNCAWAVARDKIRRGSGRM